MSANMFVFKVHKELGNGFLEAVYQEALEREFILQGIDFRTQPDVILFYKGQQLNKMYKPDFIAFEKVVVEIKAIEKLTANEEAQIINYLKATRIRVGLLLNFGSKSLEYKRMVL
ncbi:MAG: GxxExxY protein [Proteobacteria bacterium]|nr:GxxExxY protein [Pseudomonadota bacterium]